MALNCTLPGPATTPSNAGVAGIGVILGFVVPAVVSIVFSFSLIIQESFIRTEKPALGLIRRKLLFGISDQQILYGIGIQIVGLVQINTLVPYHFFIICKLQQLWAYIYIACFLSSPKMGLPTRSVMECELSLISQSHQGWSLYFRPQFTTAHSSSLLAAFTLTEFFDGYDKFSCSSTSH